MLLYLLRHGDSQNDPAISDHDRALTLEGTASIQRIAEFVKRLDLGFNAVYSSPLLRARQTAELALALLRRQPAIQFSEHLKVGADFQKLFELLNTHSADARILLVGHEPYFSRLVSTLLAGNLDAKVDIRKASLCCVESALPVGSKSGVLKWLLPPQVMLR
jgi:phosphohistidine phosphatase